MILKVIVPLVMVLFTSVSLMGQYVLLGEFFVPMTKTDDWQKGDVFI